MIRRKRRRTPIRLEVLESRTHLDAALGWAMQLGGASGFIAPQSVRPDGDFVYVAGNYTPTADFDLANTYPDNRDLLSQGEHGYFLAKYTAAGAFVWAKALGPETASANMSPYPFDMDRDTAGNFYVTGDYEGPADFGNGVTLADSGLMGDTFLAKLDPDGDAIWAKRLASEDLTTSGNTIIREPVEGYKVTVDSAGNVYTIGFFNARLVLETTTDGKGNTVPSVYLDNPSLNDDIFITKHGPTGSLLWAKQVDFLGGGSYANGSNTGIGLAVDGAGNVVAVGSLYGTADFDPGPASYIMTSQGDLDGFVLRLDVGGNFLWAGRVGGTAPDYLRSMTIDDDDNVLLAGYFKSAAADFDPGPGVAALTPFGAATSDSFLVKLSPTNQLLWAHRFGSEGDDSSLAVAADAQGNVYASGRVRGTTGDFDPGPGVVTLPGGTVGYVLRLGPGGNLDWIEGMAGLSDPATAAISNYELALDAGGNLHGVGISRGRHDFDPGPGTLALETDGVPPNYNRNGYLFRWSQVIAPGFVIAPNSALVTTEGGGPTSFGLRLTTRPAAAVTIPVASSDATEGTTTTSSLTFTPENWDIPQAVTVVGVNDPLADGDVAYAIVLGAATSADPAYAGLDPSDVAVTNLDNDPPPTKFYVVNDGGTDRTYEYGASGSSTEDYALNSGNTAPRGAASTAAGDRVWVVDVNKKVYVYNAAGGLLGSWTADGLPAKAEVEGIATNGTDIWIVDAKQDKVFRYANAASRLSGSQSAASNFALNGGNADPKDLVTDGTSLWVVNDSTSDKVFKYTTAGALLGSWSVTGAGTSPTGITLDPSGGGSLWIVDSGTDRVYHFDNARGRINLSQSPSSSFALAAGNTNPQGIADPPAGGVTSHRALRDPQGSRSGRETVRITPGRPAPWQFPVATTEDRAGTVMVTGQRVRPRKLRHTW